MNGYIFPFAALNLRTETVGGKGVNLARLSQARFPVPPGFIVSTLAYRDFVAANRLQPLILSLASGFAVDQPETVERASRSISALFSRGNFPEQMAAEITAAYSTLSFAADQPVAVRSSATTEDLPGFAFAGQHDTFLNVIGPRTLLEAVKRCWASLWSARAMTYRARNGFAPETVLLAVVVQNLVVAEVSGVMFTANPLTGKRNEIHIDASYGLGEAIVSGQVDPDHYTVDPSTWIITERRLGKKQVTIRAKAGGGTERLDREPPREQAIPDAGILELAAIGQRVAAHFAQPQDIEWVCANGSYFIVQSRPITTLYPLPEENGSDPHDYIYFNFNAIQGVPDPLTPLGIDALRLVFSGVLKTLGIRRPPERVLPEAGSRLFLDFGDLPGDPILRKIVLNFLASVEPGERDILLQLEADGRIKPRRTLTADLVFRLLGSLSPLLFSTIQRLVCYRAARDRVIREGEGYVRRVQQHLVAAPGTVKEDLDVCLRSMEMDLPDVERISVRAMPLGLIAHQMAPLLSGWLTQWLGEPPGAAMPLLRSLPGNVTVEMNLTLWAVAQAIRADEPAADAIRTQPPERLADLFRLGRLPKIVQETVAHFLEQYGMRGVAEIDLGKPRWREDPAPIFRTLKGYLQHTDPDLAPDLVVRQGAEWAEWSIADYVGRIRETHWGWLRARMFLGIAWRVRELAGLREMPLYYLAKVFALYRQALLDAGRELVEQKWIDRADDIFFIPITMLKAWVQSGEADLKAEVRNRRGVYSYEYGRKQMPRVLLSNGEAIYTGAVMRESEGQMVGMAVSPGAAEGIARVILDPRDAHLEPGDILVCPSTDPGWTPLFLTAGGLVMEIGGLMTHGSVVAREFGIPAVVGIHEATTRIKTGQRIRVDGNRGRVTL